MPRAYSNNQIKNSTDTKNRPAVMRDGSFYMEKKEEKADYATSIYDIPSPNSSLNAR